ncbi:MAG: response regulator transcription factor [Campylobacterota bacterium]
MKRLKNYNLLFLEDNASFAKDTINMFSLYFNSIYHATSIKTALQTLEQSVVHLIISDIKVDDGNALDFITQVRDQNKDIPIVILSAHKDEEFLLKAIPLNLTEYLIKPMDFETYTQTLQKVAPLLDSLYNKTQKLCDCIEYDYAGKRLIVNTNCIKLTKKEILFLELLIDKKGACASKEEIETIVWEEKAMSDAALKNFVLRLRKKLQKDIIHTIPSVGFCLGEE